MITLISIILVTIISIMAGRLIRNGKIDSLIKVYDIKGNYDYVGVNKIKNYLEDSCYALGCITGFYGMLDYSNYRNSLELLIIALVAWFIVLIVGIQLVKNNR